MIFSLSSAIFADTIRLKDGSRIKGKIVSFSGGKFTVAIGEGSRRKELSFNASEVDSIEFDAEPIRIEQAAARRTTPVPAPTPTAPTANNTADTDEDVIADDGTVASAPAPTPKTRPTAPNSNSRAIKFSVKVLADNTSNGWTNSGWVVKKGQRIRIAGDGTVTLGRGRTSDASGIADLEDAEKLMPGVPTGALIAVIGDDNNDFIYIGAEREFTAARDGALFLGVNEGNLNDNSGSFNANIEISPDSGG